MWNKKREVKQLDNSRKIQVKSLDEVAASRFFDFVLLRDTCFFQCF